MTVFKNGRQPIEMISTSQGIVKAFTWAQFGWVCIALALIGDMQTGVYVTSTQGKRRETR
jgi:hypothetical protein